MVVLITLSAIVLSVSLTACNYQVIDLNYNFNYAYIRLQNGEIIEGRVEQWRDYEDGDQLQVTINGVLYLTCAYNCTLVYDPSLEPLPTEYTTSGEEEYDLDG
jgi:hypothetical protein